MSCDTLTLFCVVTSFTKTATLHLRLCGHTNLRCVFALTSVAFQLIGVLRGLFRVELELGVPRSSREHSKQDDVPSVSGRPDVTLWAPCTAIMLQVDPTCDT